MLEDNYAVEDLFCVVFVFVVTMGTMMGIRYGEEKWSIESASKSIAAFVQKRDEEKRKAILDYFTIMIIEKEDQIDALLKEIKPPTTALDAALLMKENAWIDLIQNKEVSIVARPTYLEPFLEVDGVIIRVNRQGEWEAYKGVKEGNETFVYKLDHPIQDVKGWVKARMKKDPELLLKGANQCRSYICEQITAEREIVRDGWNSRFEQNAYIIQLVEKKPKPDRIPSVMKC